MLSAFHVAETLLKIHVHPFSFGVRWKSRTKISENSFSSPYSFSFSCLGGKYKYFGDSSYYLECYFNLRETLIWTYKQLKDRTGTLNKGERKVT